MDQSFIQMAQTFYQDEVNDALTYRALAEQAKDDTLRTSIARIARMEQDHAAFWHEFLAAQHAALPPPRLAKGRLACLQLLQTVVHPLLLVGLLELRETSSVQRYQAFLQGAPLAAADTARLQAMILDELDHEMYFKQVAHSLGVAHVRDVVLGMNDGLVELLGAVAGLSAVYPGQPLLVAVSGLIVGIAGALSMGSGAFISVRSQRQVHNGARARLELLFTVAPERAVRNYQAELVASGVPAPLAEEIARTLGTNREALANLVLPASQDNERRAGLWTGGAYLGGVLFPVLPYFFASSSLLALPVSIALAGVALTLAALVVAVLSGMSLKQKIWEMVVAGVSAAGVSYAFGTLIRSVFGLHQTPP